MNYLPANVESDSIFRENPWVKEFTFDQGYLDGKVVEIDFWHQNNPIGYRIPVTQVGNVVSVEIPVEKIRDLPSNFKYYLITDGEYLLGGSVNVKMGTGDNDSGNTRVEIQGGKIVIVQVFGNAIVSGLVERAEIAAINTEADRVQTGLDRIQTGQDRIVSTQEAGIATDMANAAIAAKNIVVPLATQVTNDRIQTGLDRIQTGLDVTTTTANALSAGNSAAISEAQAEEKGQYNAATNTPTLSANATIGQTNPNKYQSYDIVTAGAAAFGGKNFTFGQMLGLGRLKQQPNGQWSYIPSGISSLSVTNDTLALDVSIKNYPFDPGITPNAIFMAAIKDIILVDQPNQNIYTVGVLNRNVSNSWTVRIYRWDGSNIVSPSFTWTSIGYVPPTSGWDTLTLTDTGTSTGVVGAIVKIDWSLVPDFTNLINQGFSAGGISPRRNLKLFPPPVASVLNSALANSVVTKNYPFDPSITPNAIIKAAIENVQLIDALATTQYTFGVVRRNTVGQTLLRIYDWTGTALGAISYEFNATNYVPAKNQERVTLTSGSGKKAYVWVNWGNLPSGTDLVNQGFSIAGLNTQMTVIVLPDPNDNTLTNPKFSSAVLTKNLPFDPGITPNAILVSAIKDIRMYDFDPGTKYTFGVIRRDLAGTGQTLLRIYDWTDPSTFGPGSYSFDVTNYVPTKNVEWVKLVGGGKVIQVKVDWSQLPANTNVTSIPFTTGGISPLANIKLDQYMSDIAAPSIVNQAIVAAGSKAGVGAGNGTVLLDGDSRTAQNTAGLNVSNTFVNFSNLGYFCWANAFADQRATLVRNNGISGQRSDEILARTVSGYVDDFKIVIIYGPVVNDIAQNRTITAIMTSLLAIYEFYLTRGKTLIAITDNVPTSFTPTQAAMIIEVNRRIINYGTNRQNMYVVDGFRALMDASAVPLAPKSGAYYDPTHMGTKGSFLVGKALAEILKFIIPNTTTKSLGAADSYDAVSNPYQVMSNLAMTGAGGSKNGWTGNVPNLWRGTRTGTGTGNVNSLGTGPDGEPQVALTMVGNAAEERVVFGQDITPSLMGAGKTFFAECEIEVTFLSNVRSLGLELSTTIDGVVYTRSYLRDSGNVTAGNIPENYTAYLKTTPFTGIAGTVSLFQFSVSAVFSNAGSVGFKIRKARVVQIV